MKLHELAQLVNKKFIITYHPQLETYHAAFENCEVKKGGILASEYGVGSTPNLAAAAYCSSLEGETIVFHAYDKEQRMELNVPGNLTFM